MIRLRDGVSEDYGVKHSSRASSIDFITSNLSHKAKVTPENLDWALKGKSNGCRLAEPLRVSPHSKESKKIPSILSKKEPGIQTIIGLTIISPRILGIYVR